MKKLLIRAELCFGTVNKVWDKTKLEILALSLMVKVMMTLVISLTIALALSNFLGLMGKLKFEVKNIFRKFVLLCHY